MTTMAAPALVILAAGRATRFGGAKQFAPIGPQGEWLLEYTLHDAVEAGFQRAVIVLAPDSDPAIRARLDQAVGPVLALRYVVQRVDDVPSGVDPCGPRGRPWGTAHALWAARDAVAGPCAVANADDHYGRGALASLGAVLSSLSEESTEGALVGYALRDTLGARGAVNRAVCTISADDSLIGLEEIMGLVPHADGATYIDTEGRDRVLCGATTVSMNLWGLPHAFVLQLGSAFEAWHARSGGADDEFLLPRAVSQALAAGCMTVRVLHTGATWCGLTHPGDLAAVRERIQAAVSAGVYPARLWGPHA